MELLTQELHLTRLENASLQQKNQLAPPGTIPSTAPPEPIPGPEAFLEGNAAIMDVVMRQKNRSPQYLGMNPQFPSTMVVAGQLSSGKQISSFQQIVG